MAQWDLFAWLGMETLCFYAKLSQNKTGAKGSVKQTLELKAVKPIGMLQCPNIGYIYVTTVSPTMGDFYL